MFTFVTSSEVLDEGPWDDTGRVVETGETGRRLWFCVTGYVKFSISNLVKGNWSGRVGTTSGNLGPVVCPSRPRRLRLLVSLFGRLGVWSVFFSPSLPFLLVRNPTPFHRVRTLGS